MYRSGNENEDIQDLEIEEQEEEENSLVVEEATSRPEPNTRRISFNKIDKMMAPANFAKPNSFAIREQQVVKQRPTYKDFVEKNQSMNSSAFYKRAFAKQISDEDLDEFEKEDREVEKIHSQKKIGQAKGTKQKLFMLTNAVKQARHHRSVQD